MGVETLTIPVERKCSMSVVRGSLFPIRVRLKERIKIWALFYSDRFRVSGSAPPLATKVASLIKKVTLSLRSHIRGFKAFHILTWQTFHRETRNCRIHSLGETVLLLDWSVTPLERVGWGISTWTVNVIVINLGIYLFINWEINQAKKQTYIIAGPSFPPY